LKVFKKILIANRGEIAVRIIRSARELGIKTVAIYSPADANGLHVEMADESWNLESNELSESYLNVDKIVAIAKSTGAEAIHPGYGFLSENPSLVQACERENVTFIGPSAHAIKMMGNKIEARSIVRELGVPMTEGVTGTVDELMEKSKKIPLPLLVKAAAGGGGKGMRIVRDRNKLRDIIESTSREAKSYFGDGQIYVEQYIEDPRHIEIQVLGDKHGKVIHLYERECSIQRRYQKIIEESPSISLTPEVREKMGQAGASIAKNIGYDSAGTVEFLVDKNLNFYFLEMNTRIQVEHPVTEMVTGVDLVKEQILVAAGNPLTINQEDIKQKGHAIEARIYAEDPANDFLPSPGDMHFYMEPQGKHIRVDSGLKEASRVHSFYDPMISKLICWGNNRDEARWRLSAALESYIVHGVNNNISYLHHILNYQDYIQNQISTKYCDVKTPDILSDMKKYEESFSSELMVAAFLIHHMKTRRANTDSNIWNQLGLWRLLPEVRILLEEENYSVCIKENEGNNFHLSINEQDIKLNIFDIDSHQISLQYQGETHRFYIASDELSTHWITYKARTFKIMRQDELYHEEFYTSADVQGDDAIISPMPGKVIKSVVKPGQEVKKGDLLLIVEAMKMENSIEAMRDAIIEEVFVQEGEMVDNGQLLIKLMEEE
jgi:3-methylcrotonyl-CoA carboxylase alpha subunit